MPADKISRKTEFIFRGTVTEYTATSNGIKKHQIQLSNIKFGLILTEIVFLSLSSPGKTYPHRRPERAVFTRRHAAHPLKISVHPACLILCNESLFPQINGIITVFSPVQNCARKTPFFPSIFPKKGGNRGTRETKISKMVGKIYWIKLWAKRWPKYQNSPMVNHPIAIFTGKYPYGEEYPTKSNSDHVVFLRFSM